MAMLRAQLPSNPNLSFLIESHQCNGNAEPPGAEAVLVDVGSALLGGKAAPSGAVVVGVLLQSQAQAGAAAGGWCKGEAGGARPVEVDQGRRWCPRSVPCIFQDRLKLQTATAAPPYPRHLTSMRRRAWHWQT